jgi:hypothetical protein
VKTFLIGFKHTLDFTNRTCCETETERKRRMQKKVKKFMRRGGEGA